MILYFVVARLCLKCPTHGVSYCPIDVPEDHMTLTESDKSDGDNKNHAYFPSGETLISYITY